MYLKKQEVGGDEDYATSSTPKAPISSITLDLSPASSRPIHESSPSKWEVGYSGEVIIKAAENVDSIYVQAVTDEKRILSDKIRTELKEYSKYSVIPSAIPAIGTFIAVLLDENIYRARITDVNGEAIRIFWLTLDLRQQYPLKKFECFPIAFLSIHHL